MKRNLLYLVLCISLMVGITGCYDDQSSEATHSIPEIVIDTTGIDAKFTLKRFDRLQINPKVSKENTDPSAFSYKWMLSMAPVKFGTQDAYECISENMNLDEVIDRDDDETTYRLWYQVTDNTTGLRKDIIWEIRVMAPYGEGLLIAEEVEGGTDLALIESKEFTEGYDDQPLIRHGIYSEANDEAKIDADVFQLSAFREGNNSFTKYYMLLGKNGSDKYLLLRKTYKVQHRNEEGFEEYAANEIDPKQFIVYAYACYLVNDGMLHYLWTSPNSTQMKWGAPMPYQDGYMAMNRLAGGLYSGSPSYSFYFDKANNCIKTLGNTTMRWDMANVYTATKVDGLGFDPNNCPGIEIIYGSIAPNNRVYGLIKNQNGSYSILGLNSSNKFDTYYEIPECELNNAIAYACNEMGNVFYFATSQKLYAIQLNAEPVRVEEIYSTTDEITHMSIFRQAKNTTYSSYATLEGSGETILIATWDGNEGTVNYVPIKNFNTGELEAESEWKKFTGFGRISTLTHQYP